MIKWYITTPQALVFGAMLFFMGMGIETNKKGKEVADILWFVSAVVLCVMGSVMN